MKTADKVFRMGVLSLCLVLFNCVTGCVVLEQGPIVSSVPWPEKIGTILNVGTNGNYLWAEYSKPSAFHIWQWHNNTIVKRYELPSTEETYSVFMLPNDRWLASVKGGFCIGDLKSGSIESRWPVPEGLDVSLRDASRNGNHIAAEARDMKSDDRCSIHIGLVVPEEKGFRWAACLSPDYGDFVGGGVTNVVPSNDGKYIGVAGWNNGVAMIDVVNKKVLWTASYEHEPGIRTPEEKNSVSWKTLPFDSVAIDGLAFAPDGRTIYVGGAISSNTVGAAGCVWEIKTETGETLRQWGTDNPKPSEYSRSVTTVSVSPNGRFVAAGTVPGGLVYLISTKDGQRQILNHSSPAAIDIVSFSPDSTRLATYSGTDSLGEIKIWKLPE